MKLTAIALIAMCLLVLRSHAFVPTGPWMRGLVIPSTIRAVPEVPLASSSCAKCDDSDASGKAATCITSNTPPSTFIQMSTPLTASDLTDANLLKIVIEEATDEDVNVLLWKCLGYVYDEAAGTWSASKVFPKWSLKFPQPPDMIGVTRQYDPETDRLVRNASMDLMRSVPRDFKVNLPQTPSPSISLLLLLQNLYLPPTP